ncbi:tetratricopeptide repeat protein [Pseudonocardia nigra]|uniref:tetratricopeptide repeat protein n=1 Tax=Pseudonocardia nigra TaxID=1921578 RepID=UPI001C5FAF61|nr:tetratricopeptide repeat protein [Pseudonocardia nigra]
MPVPTLESVLSRVDRYLATGDRAAVLGPGVLPDAGPLWRAGLSEAGASVEVLDALARLHWCRYRACDGNDVLNDLQAALVLFARVGQVDPELVPADLRPILARGVTVDHQFIGPEHWGRVGIRLLRQAETHPDVAILDQAVEIFEGTVAVYPPSHPFCPGDMRNLRYALRLRYGIRRDPDDRRRSIEVNRALLRGRSPGEPGEPLGPDAPPVPPLPPKVGRFRAGRELERRLQRVAELHVLGQFELAEDEARDLLHVLEDLRRPDDPVTIRLITLLASTLAALGESDDAQRAQAEALARTRRATGR